MNDVVIEMTIDCLKHLRFKLLSNLVIEKDFRKYWKKKKIE